MSEKHLPKYSLATKGAIYVGTGLSDFMSNWIKSIPEKSFNSLPLKTYLNKENIWNQSHSPKFLESIIV